MEIGAGVRISGLFTLKVSFYQGTAVKIDHLLSSIMISDAGFPVA